MYLTLRFGVMLGSVLVCWAQRPAPLSQTQELEREGFSLQFPAGWSYAQDAGVKRLIALPASRAEAALSAEQADRIPLVFVTTENRSSHAEAVQRLREIASESTATVTFLVIGGWPALQRREIADREQPGEKLPYKLSPKVLKLTTAIAAGNLVVRLDGRMPPDAGRGREQDVRSIGSGVLFRSAAQPGQTEQDLRSLRANPKLKPTPAPAPTRRVPGAEGSIRRPTARERNATPEIALAGVAAADVAPQLEAGLAQRVLGVGAGELEMAVSTNGQNIVIAQQFRFTTSNDGGRTFPINGNFPSSTGGDPSLAFGRSGAFYEGTINGSSTGFNFSTNNGQTFTFRANAYTCPVAAPQCGGFPFPDQEHIAADRFNAATGGGDQVYSAWRQGGANWGLVCSTDGAQNWTAGVFTAGDFPRITAGQDGFVYIIYMQGNNIMVDKRSSCQNGLASQAGYPRNVVTGSAGAYVPCPVPGLDRCNSGNLLHSHTIAVDDRDATHFYIAYAQTSAAGNENVIVRDFFDNGATFTTGGAATVNSAVNARRFMPWVCSAGGNAYVSWFDRRAATAANNDLTDFYAGSAFRDAGGNLVPGAEVRLNPPGTADAHCAAGRPAGSAQSWGGSARATTDSESCSVQPQLAGRCLLGGGGGSGTPCDFSAGGCAAGETCQTGGGIPKYGDYNGNACAVGRLYTIWPSATRAAGLGASNGIETYFSANIVCCSPQIQIPGPVVFPNSCAGDNPTETMTICNNGKADLRIDAITVSNANVSVATPSSGFPVLIPPGSCFPFRVTLNGATPGPKSATITIVSDDPVNPNATVTASGTVGQPVVATVVADTGGFGTVCPGSFRDLAVLIENKGACRLLVSGVTTGTADFQVPGVVSFPLAVAPGSSISLPIRFQPTSPGAKSDTITISTNDAATPTSQIRVNGVGGQPVIVTMVPDSGDFGSVCTRSHRDMPVTINNSGTCALKISAITSSSPEFQLAQTNAFPVVVAPGASVAIPIRYAPTTAGAKTATITFASDDPATPAKSVTLTANTAPEWICHPSSFTSLGFYLGPTFGKGRPGSYSGGAKGRHLMPFGERKNFGLQAEGEYIFYPRFREGEFDAALLWRHEIVQLGFAGSFKHIHESTLGRGGGLGQATFMADFLLPKVRFGFFGSKAFADEAPVSNFLTLRVVDQAGGNVQVGITPRTYVDGTLAYLFTHAPMTPDMAGAQVRLTHFVARQIALFVAVDINQTYVATKTNGRFVVGLQFGRWSRPRDYTNRGNPLGAEIPRVHYQYSPRRP